MNVYMDLSFVLQILLGYTSLYFIRIILIKRSTHILFEIVFSLVLGSSVFLIYFEYFFSVLIYLLVVSLFLLVIYKKESLKAIILYFFCYTILTFIIDKLSIYNSTYNFILIINDNRGIISYLFAPIFLISLLISSKLVDHLYRLNTFKTSCYLIKGDRKIYYTCYYDSGNVLRHNDIPVIFINKNKYLFIMANNEQILIEGINGKTINRIDKCLLSLEDKKETYIVYVCLVETKDFNGCEILLNAYLM